MFRRLGLKYFCSKLKPQSIKISKMADKIEIMNKTMHETSPKIFSIFFILSTVPTFYYTYQLITSGFHQKQYSSNATSALNYMNLKNLVIYGSIATLLKLRYSAPTAKFTVEKRGLIGRLAPLVLSLVALALPPSCDSKYIVLPTFMADCSMLIFQAQIANFGVYPFWMYSYRHYIRFFEWISLFIIYFCLSKLRKRIQTHPHQFLEQQSQDKKQQSTNQINNEG